MKPVAVIILNWNGAELLRQFLPSVLWHTPGAIADIYVADNGSEDDSLQVLAEEFPQAQVIRLDRNYGFAEGYNRAIAAAGHKYSVLLNSDVEVRSDWLTPLYDYMTRHPDAGAVQPKILSIREEGRFEYAGAAGGFLDCNGYPYCRGRIFDTVEPDNGQYDETIDVMWASGAALMVDTELYLRLGGLDPAFFAHMEEIDLCWRMLNSGRRVAAVVEAEVYHLGGASLDASDPRKTYLNFRNSLFMLRKNLPAALSRSWLLIRRRLLDTAAFAKFLLSGKWGHAWAIVKAHIHYLTLLKTIAMPTEAPTRNLLKGRVNILVEYYLKGKKRYSEIAEA